MKIFNEVRVKENSVVLDGKELEAKFGKHCIWVPATEMKMVLSFHGGIDSNAWMRGSKAEAINNFTFNDKSGGFSPSALTSLATEFKILSMLADHKMSPRPREFFFIKNIISSIFTSGKHCDSQGWYGYFIDNAEKLDPGRYTFENFKNVFLDTGRIYASQGAIGDLAKKEGNLVNGYLVDVRRSLFDMMKVNEPMIPFSPYKENRISLQNRIFHGAQFPHKDRKQNYQTYYMDGEYIKGTRDTLYRFEKMGISADLKGMSVLDLGCQLGSMAMETWRRGARKITGIEYEKDFVDCARDLSRYNGIYVNFMHMDLTHTNEVANYINSYYPEGIDLVFALSLYKHIKESKFHLLSKLKFKTCYIESHNTGTTGLETGHVKEMIDYMKRLNYKYTHLGFTEDRSPRAIWRIDR